MTRLTITTVSCDQCQDQVDGAVTGREGWLRLSTRYEELDFCSPDCLRSYAKPARRWRDYLCDIVDELAGLYPRIYTKSLNTLMERNNNET